MGTRRLLPIQFLDNRRDTFGVVAGAFAHGVDGGDLALPVDDDSKAFDGDAAAGFALFVLRVDRRRLASFADRDAERFGGFALFVGEERERQFVVSLEELVRLD